MRDALSRVLQSDAEAHACGLEVLEVLSGPDRVGDARCVVEAIGCFGSPQVQQVGMGMLLEFMAHEGPRALTLSIEVGRLVLRAARPNWADPSMLSPALAILGEASSADIDYPETAELYVWSLKSNGGDISRRA